jgi:monothiol glutaredoxin
MIRINKIFSQLSKNAIRNYIPLFTSRSFSINTFSKMTVRNFAEDDSHNDFKPKVKQTITDENVMGMIDDLVKNNTVVVFMKGTREMPRCGFSNSMIQILNYFDVKEIKCVNILENQILREAVKKYSNWPTYPQLYIKGNLIGLILLIKVDVIL